MSLFHLHPPSHCSIKLARPPLSPILTGVGGLLGFSQHKNGRKSCQKVAGIRTQSTLNPGEKEQIKTSFLWTAVPTVYKKSVRFNPPGLGAVDAKHLDLCTGPEDVRMLHSPPGSLPASKCGTDLGERSTWPDLHFLGGASAHLPVDWTHLG